MRFHGSHVFNPAGLALLASVPLFGSTQSWWGALADLPWVWLPLLFAGGWFITDRLNKWPLVLAFTGAYFALFTGISLAAPDRVAELYRSPFLNAALFLAFFMLTDPPTSPVTTRGQAVVGVVAAVAACGALLLGAGQVYLLVGLLAGNLAVVALRRGGATA